MQNTMNNSRANQIITLLELQAHPEGGYFKETYRSEGHINEDSLGSEYEGKRHFSTCTYFLLTSKNFSAFHRIKQDEIWHFYDGSTLRLHIIDADGQYSNHLIGNNLANGEVPQFVVEGGSWFAAEVIESQGFSFVGCTVSPGFSYEDFELISQAELSRMYPEHSTIIAKLTRH